MFLASFSLSTPRCDIKFFLQTANFIRELFGKKSEMIFTKIYYKFPFHWLFLYFVRCTLLAIHGKRVLPLIYPIRGMRAPFFFPARLTHCCFPAYSFLVSFLWALIWYWGSDRFLLFVTKQSSKKENNNTNATLQLPFLETYSVLHGGKAILKSLAWENRRHFTLPLLVSPRNEVWGTCAETP